MSDIQDGYRPGALGHLRWLFEIRMAYRFQPAL